MCALTPSLGRSLVQAVSKALQRVTIDINTSSSKLFGVLPLDS